MILVNVRRPSRILFIGAVLTALTWHARAQSTPEREAVLGLDFALQTALTESPQLAMAGLGADALRQVGAQAGTLPDPVLQAAFSPRPVHTARGTQRSQFRLEQAFPFPGKRKLRRQVADLRADVAQYEVEALRQDIAQQVRSAYARLYALQERLDILSTFEDEIRSFEEAAAAEYEVGRGPQQALLRAQLERNTISKRALQLRASRHEAVRDLATLMNRPELMADSFRVERPVPLEDLRGETSYEVAARQRPEFRAVDRALKGADRAIDLARRDYYPDVTLQVTYTDIAKDTPPVNPDGANALAVGAGVRIPLWRGALSAKRQQREIERRRLDEHQRALEADTRIRLEELRQRIRLEQENLALLSGGLVPQAEITRDATLAAYTTGRASFLDLLEAERMLFELKLDEISTRERLHEAVASVHRVLGTPIDFE